MSTTNSIEEIVYATRWVNRTEGLVLQEKRRKVVWDGPTWRYQYVWMDVKVAEEKDD